MYDDILSLIMITIQYQYIAQPYFFCCETELFTSMMTDDMSVLSFKQTHSRKSYKSVWYNIHSWL